MSDHSHVVHVRFLHCTIAVPGALSVTILIPNNISFILKVSVWAALAFQNAPVWIMIRHVLTEQHA